MNTEVLLVSFGTTYQEAREKSLQRIAADLEEAAFPIPVKQAYTSGMVIRSLAEQGIKVNTMEEAVREALERQVKRLYVLPTHMIPGIEYHKLLREIDRWRPYFECIKTAAPVLETEEDCARLVPVLQSILEPEEDVEYILMGHGTESDANIRYAQMNQALERAGLTQVRIASVEAKPDLEDAVRILKERGRTGKAVLHPFMVVAGNHAQNDMAGQEDSYVTRLLEEGWQVEARVRGLGEYPVFRRLYVDKLKAMMR